MKYLILILSGIGLILMPGCLTRPKYSTNSGLPSVPREFRAAWVASVANINWPSSPGLPIEIQKSEALYLLDLLDSLRYNAVILQVRPQCDALYKSDLEPWSYYLTGAQGVAPNPEYDPLDFWIDESHKRGIELHAWLNPYRAHHPEGGEVTDFSIIRQKPELVLALKDGYWWLDPSKAETQDHSYDVAMDLVDRYDIDGLHFDDYFYPYPSYNDNLDFPDHSSYVQYKSNGGDLSIGDWRRDHVNRFIKRVYKGIKRRKRYVKFGISPFGIWRPGFPESIKGFDQYDQLYADAKLWLSKGWVDYFTPQLYWPVNQIPQSFPVLLGWWLDQNKKQRYIWPGCNLTRLKGKAGHDEAINQIMITRGMVKKNSGIVHWSISPLIDDDSLRTALLEGPFSLDAVAPAMNWLRHGAPRAPRLADQDRLVMTEDITHIIFYYYEDNRWNFLVLPGYKKEISLSGLPFKQKKVMISVVNRYGVESPAIPIQLP